MLSFTKTIDRAGRLIESRDAYNRRLRYEYTAGGRRSKMTWPDGFYVRYYYDEAGRLWKIIDREENLLAEYAYDAAGRVVSVAKLGLTTTYDYEDVNPGDNRGIYLDSVVNSAGNEILDFYYSRDLAGNITTKSGSDGSIDYLYDKNYSLISVVFEDDSELVFTYDNLFNRVLVEYGLETIDYTLNSSGLNQYATADSVILDYDLNGNLIQKGSWHYLYDSENQLIANYNLSGEPNETQVSLYSYDSFGRRVSKAMAIGVDSTSAAATESYLYDGFQVVGEYNENGELVRRFVYGNGIDEVVAMYDVPQGEYYGYEDFAMLAASWLCTPQDACYNPVVDFNGNGIVDANDLENFAVNYYLTRKNDTYYTEIYSFAYDGLGSVVGVVKNEPNNLSFFVETYEYDAFGAATIYDANGISLTQSAIGNPYLFTGRRYDSESGLYYYRFRMYDAQLGSFLQTDPIGYYDSMNLYQYCLNNPINYTDPWGLFRFGIRDLSFLPKGSMVLPIITSPSVAIVAIGFNLGLYHQQGFFEDNTGDNVGYFRPLGNITHGGITWSNAKKGGENTDDYILSPWQYDDNLIRTAINNITTTNRFTAENYKTIGNNCQDFATAIKKEYKKLGGKVRFRPLF